MKLKRDCDAVDEELRQMTGRLSVLQERFDSQSMTLKLAKEHSGDLQERLLLSEKAHATKLESTHGQYKAELAVLEEQKNSLQNATARLRDDISKLDSTVEKLREERAALQGSLERYRHENTRLESNADIHTSEISTLRERVAVLQDQTFDIARLKDESASLQLTISKQTSEIAVLNTEKTVLEKSVEKHVCDIAGLQCKLMELQEERSSLSERVGALIKQEEASERVLSVEIKRAEAAEQGLTELTKELAKRIGNMETQLETAQIAAAAASVKPNSEQESMEVDNAKIEELESEIARLRERETSLDKRYRDGELSDSEKEFVNSLIKFSQDMHEKEMVAKENELRRRDNMNTTLQQKVDKLASTLAKVLKGQGNGNVALAGSKEKSMLDLDMWMSSPLTDTEQHIVDAVPTVPIATGSVPARFPLSSPSALAQVRPSTTRPARASPLSPAPQRERGPGGGGEGVVGAGGRSTIAAMKARENAPPSSAPSATPTFSKLEEDISDFEEDFPLAGASARLGKRTRPGSPTAPNKARSGQDGEGPRPARRSKFGVRKEGDQNQAPRMEKKVENTKVKSRKHR
ncbi:hypothetical protein GYMLUDRAFT_971743 [Collybiopsis luxurians FD-317 M1]|uniref:Uncharacterized protein n=1 Tax=Collybiopsis luxurians FD-317 M1 TaxID=944289 RepID=A0A0D0C2W9_9AGAR|nr:hypothetical protein GYMLUDRAFT_971743 [Collybiopsis luxurians FD-317 M1]